MYSPELFRERDPDRLFGLIDAHPFGTLLAPGGDGGLSIAHVPFLLDRGAGPHGRLRLHVARANPIWRDAAAGRPLVAVFHGADAYVSAAWYEHPEEQVPTWNYTVVHAHGRGAIMTPDELRRLLADLAAAHESAAPGAWRVDLLDPQFVTDLLEEIVGIAIEVQRLDGKFKLSQNRSPADRARVARALAQRGGPDDRELVAWMA
jgi:transcriptional regulator